MIHQVFSVFDSKAEAFLPPVYFRSRGEFLRAFGDSVNDPKSNLSKYPQDYTAFWLGTWDDSNAVFTAQPTPVSLGLAIEFVVQRKDVT